MNTIQVQSTLTQVGNTGAMDAVSGTSKKAALPGPAVVAKVDHYSATAANDTVVARVITASIGKSFSSSASSDDFTSNSAQKLHERFTTRADNQEITANNNTVTKNVVGFVESALANLAKRGFNKDQLSFFRNEAVKGVEVGIDQAKLDLIGLVNDDTFRRIDDTKRSIIGGIHQLPVEPHEYQRTIKNIEQVERGTQRELAAVTVNSVNNETIKLDFETRAFNAAQLQDSKSLYTTSSSNISFAVQANSDPSSHKDIANLVNKVDGLANSFYRGDVQSAYTKSKELGYSDSELLGLAKQLNKTDTFQQMKMYEDIQHLSILSKQTDFAAPKAVAEYVNRYLDVLESSKATLGSDKDFNQVINGLVNQMKDVQVPDLLQAINRFHAFNKKFG